MPNINKLPLGLLGFLGIKNGGRYPEELSNILSGTWDLGPLYLDTNSENSSAVLAIAGIGSQAFFTVPVGQAWWVRYGSAATGTLGAGQTIQLGLQTTDAAGLVTTAINQMSQSRTVGQRCATALERDVILGPGATFGINCTELVAGPVNVTVAIRFARLLM